jgi:hypothetical protein
MATDSLTPNLTFDCARQLLIDHVREHKHSICVTCGEAKIESAEKAAAHRRSGHVVLDYCDYKNEPAN